MKPDTQNYYRVSKNAGSNVAVATPLLANYASIGFPSAGFGYTAAATQPILLQNQALYLRDYCSWIWDPAATGYLYAYQPTDLWVEDGVSFTILIADHSGSDFAVGVWATPASIPQGVQLNGKGLTGRLRDVWIEAEDWNALLGTVVQPLFLSWFNVVNTDPVSNHNVNYTEVAGWEIWQRKAGSNALGEPPLP